LAISEIGGEMWSTPRLGQTVIPICCSIARYTLGSEGADRDRILWTGPKGPDRNNLVVRVSYDEGESFVGERLIAADGAAYSDLTFLLDGNVGVLWERGGYRSITFSQFVLNFLELDSNG
jgi:sialidase-1